MQLRLAAHITHVIHRKPTGNTSHVIYVAMCIANRISDDTCSMGDTWRMCDTYCTSVVSGTCDTAHMTHEVYVAYIHI